MLWFVRPIISITQNISLWFSCRMIDIIVRRNPCTLVRSIFVITPILRMYDRHFWKIRISRENVFPKQTRPFRFDKWSPSWNVVKMTTGILDMAFVRGCRRSHFRYHRVYVWPIFRSPIIWSTRYMSQRKERGDGGVGVEGDRKIVRRCDRKEGEGRQVRIESWAETAGRIWGPWGREVCKCGSTFISAPRPCISWKLPEALSGTNRIPTLPPRHPAVGEHARKYTLMHMRTHMCSALVCTRMCHQSDTPEIYEQTSLVPRANRPASYGPIQFNFENKQPPLDDVGQFIPRSREPAAMRLYSDIAEVWISHT